MGQSATIATTVPTPGSRSGASRKLLTRKALEKPPALGVEPLEASFPPPEDSPPKQHNQLSSTSASAPTAAPYALPPALAAWSSEDEASFQALLVRRKASGYQRRGRDLSAQVLRPGTIRPNQDTIVATIVALVAERGELSRGELLSQMAITSFPLPKAQPSNKGWCQGYVAGAIRNRFLAVANEPSTTAGKEG